jgi:inosine-uridine nucleoside N-ribohydrolase
MENSGKPEGRAAGKIARASMNQIRKTLATGGPAMHDSLAVGTFLDPSIVTLQDLYVEVETAGTITAGETVGYRKAPMRGSPPMANGPAVEASKEFRPNAQVALEVDVNRFLKLLVDRIAG